MKRSHPTGPYSLTRPQLFALACAVALIPSACGNDQRDRDDGSDATGGDAADGSGGDGPTSDGSGGEQNGSGASNSGGSDSTGGQSSGGSDNTGGAGGIGGMGGEANSPGGVFVFEDDYAEGVSFVPFGGSVNDVSVDTGTAYSGNASLKIEVPAAGYTGGALAAATPRDMSDFNALTFWAKASESRNLDKTGFGNDAGGGTMLSAESGVMELTTEWQQFVLPLPSPSSFTAEKGLFHFAEGEGAAYTIWFDDIQYVEANDLPTAAPALATVTQPLLVGDTFAVPGTVVTYPFASDDVTLTLSPAWFDYSSTDELVATVDAGLITALSAGSADISATLDGIVVAGTVSVEVSEASTPSTPAPVPTIDSLDVISLFSNAYTNVLIDTWSTGWDQADFSELQIEGDDTLLYQNLVFAGVEFSSTTIDASAMQYLHVDVWMPLSTVFKLKLVDFGVNGTYEPTADNTEVEVTRSGLTPKTWVGLDFELTEFSGMNLDHLAQMILAAESNGSKVYLDNMYFYSN